MSTPIAAARSTTLASLLLCGLIAGCGSSTPPAPGGPGAPGMPGAPGSEAPAPTAENIDAEFADTVADAEQRGCDFLDPAYCQFPWPSDALTVADDSTATGRRLNLAIQGMPMNIAGIPMDPSEWNVDDGFSPGQMMLTHVPDLDLAQTGVAPITDIEASLASEAPIFIIDAQTLERHPVWVEFDTSDTASTPVCDAAPGVSELFALIGDAPEGLSEVLGTLSEGCATALAPIFAALGDALEAGLPNNAFKVDPPALILRPGVNFIEGRRYIVALRDLRDADGELLAAPAGFRVFRDRHVSELDTVNARRPAMEDILARLEQHGVARESLYLAWDFTVRSRRNGAGRTLQMRDRAFEMLGDNAPEFEIVDVQDIEAGASIRRIEGVFTVPNFLNVPDGLCDNTPLASDIADYCAGIEDTLAQLAGIEAPGISDAAGGIADGFELLLRDIGQLPLSRLNYATPRGEFPEINPLQPEQSYRFQCEIPRSAIGSFIDPDTWTRPAVATLYGHGLLGGKGEVGGSSTERLRELNLMHCAIDWIGMATRDVPMTLVILLEMGQFRSLTDRLQQGIVNWHFMARLLSHPDGLASDPNFQSADGRPVFGSERVVYDGNSQGGILSAPVIATSPEVTRASFGVPGMNYSTLLRRSVDFDPFGVFFYAAYPNSFDQSFILSLINNLWDRGENNGYINDLRNQDALAGLGAPTPDKEILMHVAFGDHQVADVSAEVMNRSMGGRVHRPAVEEGRHSNVNPYWGMPSATDGPASTALVIWDIGPLDNPFNAGTPTSPTGNTPPNIGQDPHGDPRKERSSGIQRYDFLVRDRYTNVCGPRPCFAREYVSAAVASGSAGNQAPLVRAPGPANARAGSSATVFAIASDADRDALTFAWRVTEGADCVAALTDAEQAVAQITLTADCTQDAVTLAVTASDGRGGVAEADTQVQLLR